MELELEASLLLRGLRERLAQASASEPGPPELQALRLVHHCFEELARARRISLISACLQQSPDQLVTFYSLLSLNRLLAQEVVLVGREERAQLRSLLDWLFSRLTAEVPRQIFEQMTALSAKVLVRFSTPEETAQSIENYETQALESNYKHFGSLKVLQKVLEEITAVRGNRRLARQVEGLPELLFGVGFESLVAVVVRSVEGKVEASSSSKSCTGTEEVEGFHSQEAREIEKLIRLVDDHSGTEVEADLKELLIEGLQLMHAAMLFDFQGCRAEQDLDEFVASRSPLLLPVRPREYQGFLKLKSPLFIRLLDRLFNLHRDQRVRVLLLAILGDCARITLRFFKSSPLHVGYLEFLSCFLSKITKELSEHLLSEEAISLLPAVLAASLKLLQCFEPRTYCENEYLAMWLRLTVSLLCSLPESRVVSFPFAQPLVETLARLSCYRRQSAAHPQLQEHLGKLGLAFAQLCDLCTQQKNYCYLLEHRERGSLLLSDPSKLLETTQHFDRLPVQLRGATVLKLVEKANFIMDVIESETSLLRLRYAAELLQKLILCVCLVADEPSYLGDAFAGLVSRALQQEEIESHPELRQLAGMLALLLVKFAPSLDNSTLASLLPLCITAKMQLLEPYDLSPSAILRPCFNHPHVFRNCGADLTSVLECRRRVAVAACRDAQQTQLQTLLLAKIDLYLNRCNEACDLLKSVEQGQASEAISTCLLLLPDLLEGEAQFVLGLVIRRMYSVIQAALEQQVFQSLLILLVRGVAGRPLDSQLRWRPTLETLVTGTVRAKSFTFQLVWACLQAGVACNSDEFKQYLMARIRMQLEDQQTLHTLGRSVLHLLGRGSEGLDPQAVFKFGFELSMQPEEKLYQLSLDLLLAVIEIPCAEYDEQLAYNLIHRLLKSLTLKWAVPREAKLLLLLATRFRQSVAELMSELKAELGPSVSGIALALQQQRAHQAWQGLLEWQQEAMSCSRCITDNVE